MLRTLLESRSRNSANRLGAGASAAIHATLIGLAAYATAAGAPSSSREEPPDIVHWVNPSPSATPERHNAAPARNPAQVAATARPTSVSPAISPNIPDVNIPLGGVRPDDFTSSPGALLSSDNPGSTGIGAGPEKSTYDAYEVDRPVSAISGSAPAYPSAMRAAGIEGEVRAEFVVDDKGRADPASLRIVTATNAQFASAVRDALPRMRFAPAELRGRPVAQLVQQLFAFRLSR